MRVLRDRKGAAAAEFALVSLLLMTMIFGTFQYGSLLFTYVAMEDAARNAARALAVCAISTESDAIAQARPTLPSWIAAGNFTFSLPATADANDVAFQISVPSSKATILSLVPMPEMLTTSVTMRYEPLSYAPGSCLSGA